MRVGQDPFGPGPAHGVRWRGSRSESIVETMRVPDEAPQPDRAPIEPAPEPTSWRQVWQAPLLLVALGLIGSGMVIGMLTRPAPDFDSRLDRGESLIRRDRFVEAIDSLNGQVYPFLGAGKLRPDHVRRYHLLVGRAIGLGQADARITNPANDENIVRSYLRAEEANATLQPRDVEILTGALIRLGHGERALARAQSLTDEQGDTRRGVYKTLISHKMSLPGLDYDGTLTLLDRLNRDPTLTVPDRVWALARETDLRLREGYADEAIARLLRVMPAVSDAPPELLGELYLLLGRAYIETGAGSEGAKRLETAVQTLPAGSDHQAEALMLLGAVSQAAGEFDLARERYDEVISRFGSSQAYLPALMGTAELDAIDANDDESVSTYAQVLQEMRNGRQSDMLTRQDVGDSLLARFLERYGSEQLEPALRYAVLAEDLFPAGHVPPDVLEALALSYRALADRQLDPARTLPGGGVDLTELDPVSRAQVRQRLITAGGYFRKHADAMVLSDPARFAESLWACAQAYDQAGDVDMAIQSFSEYANAFPNDPRHGEARFRLAQAHQARGEYPLAAELFETIIRDSSDIEGGKGVGIFGPMSYVPLAQCYLLDADPGNDERAENLLETVLSGAVGDPSTLHFRDARLELATLYYQTGRYPRAIEQFDLSLGMDDQPVHPERVRFKLADAHRLEAESIRQTLEAEAMPDEQRRALERARDAHLATSLSLFTQVRDALGARDARKLAPIDRLYLRDASLYMGDCAFDRKDYDTAIRHYDSARDRYQKDPASLVAMVQIVNAYIAQGDVARARTANQRAKDFYASLPADAWDDPNLPMSRGDWERWLDSIDEINRLADAGKKE